MKLLLIAGSADTKKILNKLLRKSGHILEGRDIADCHCIDLTTYDMLLVDGSLKACEEASLQELLRKVRNKSPQVQIVVLDVLGASTHAEGYVAAHRTSCGAVKSGNGVWQLRCRLKELALEEAQARLLDAVMRPPCEPITFEYQG